MQMPRRPLGPDERRDWLRLIRTQSVGPMTFRSLLARFGSAAAALEALPELSRRAGRAEALRPPPAAVIDRELERLHALNARLIGLAEPDYPAPLATIEDAPPLIAVRGDAGLLARPALGIVGARNASLNGRRMAERMAAALGRAGWVIVSGMARGIDAAAHTGALASGTVACLAGGVDIVFPPEHQGLYERLVAEGAVIAELPPGTQPLARHFPRRNRLISGLSRGVVVVEAAPRSGSLITARLASEQGRDVFAVPGSPLDPRAQGCNQLIRRGATLVQGAEDVLEDLSGSLPHGTAASPVQPEPAGGPPEPADDGLRARVLECLAPAPVPVDDIVRACAAPAASVLTALLDLELAGLARRHPGHQASLAEPL